MLDRARPLAHDPLGQRALVEVPDGVTVMPNRFHSYRIRGRASGFSLGPDRVLSAEAAPAINRPVAAGAERDGRALTALRADGIEHLTGAAGPRTTLRFARRPAVAATLRFVLEALFRIKHLIADRKIKRGSAVFASQRFIFVQPPATGRPKWCARPSIGNGEG